MAPSHRRHVPPLESRQLLPRRRSRHAHAPQQKAGAAIAAAETHWVRQACPIRHSEVTRERGSPLAHLVRHSCTAWLAPRGGRSWERRKPRRSRPQWHALFVALSWLTFFADVRPALSAMTRAAAAPSRRHRCRPGWNVAQHHLQRALAPKATIVTPPPPRAISQPPIASAARPSSAALSRVNYEINQEGRLSRGGSLGSSRQVFLSTS